LKNLSVSHATHLQKILGCASVEFVQRRSRNEAPARKGSYLPTLDLALAVI
jgi:hypothetical protein